MDLKNNQLSQIYTPDYVAEFMVKNVKKYYLTTHLSGKIDHVKVLEPCAGQGIFLRYLLYEGFSDVTAYELDINLRPHLLKTFPDVNFKFENFLGTNLEDKYDIIIGNPPYLGQNYNAEVFQNLMKNYPICQEYFVGNMDLFYYFIHLGIIKLNPGAILSYITTNYWITKSKKTGIKKLKPHIINDCFLLQYIDLSNLRIFKGAKGQHNCIFLIQKKNEEEKLNSVNKEIQIIQIPNSTNNIKKYAYERTFKSFLLEKKSSDVITYPSSLSNKELNGQSNWNLLCPREAKELIKKVEIYCKQNNQTTFLKDFFIIRNGLILVKDEFFILKEGKNIKIEKSDWLIKIQDKFIKLTENEKNKLKKIYKSSAIIPYNYLKGKISGFLIYFNKFEIKNQDSPNRNNILKQKYPNLIDYLDQFKEKMEEILINAKESPLDLYYPRRGSFIIQYDNKNEPNLINLEQYYETFPKIFFKYISKSNIFGYTNDSYYATSDTYFLWPKNMDQKYDYLFLIAYLNSKLVKFLFKAKNIFIKRSKTKLEENLPLPNLTQFQESKYKLIIKLIKFLAGLIIKIQNCENLKNSTDLILELEFYGEILSKDDMIQIKTGVKDSEIHLVQKVIDVLFFQLFHIEEKEVDGLLEKYYSF